MSLAEGRGAERSEESERRLSQFAERLDVLEKKIAVGSSDNDAAGAGTDTELLTLRSEITSRLEAQVEALEKRLREELDRSHDDQLTRLSDALEKRVSERIAPIEAEMATQSAAVAELREYSLRNEKTLQKLLQVIDRLTEAQTSSKGAVRSRE